MSQGVKTSARGLVLPRSSSPENGHLRKKNSTFSNKGHVDVNEHERLSICTIRSKRFRNKASVAVLHVTVTVTIEALMLILDSVCTNNEFIDMEIIQCLISKLFQVITK